MHKSTKGGIAIEELTGVLVVLFVAVILIFAFYIMNIFNQIEKQKLVESSTQNIDIDYNLNYFLRMPIENNQIIADVADQTFINNNYDEFIILESDYFGDIYETQGLNYYITIEGKPINSLEFVDIVENSQVQIPSMTKQVLDIELVTGKQSLIIRP